MTSPIDISGKRFGRLVVIKRNGSFSNGKKNGASIAAWLCECDCGNNVTIRGRDLISGNTKSCGCYALECKAERKTTHGMCGSKIHKLWNEIKKRATGKGNSITKKTYKGIGIDPTWLEFKNFYKWALGKWHDGLEIDRINTLYGYGPDNCRFVAHKINTQNTKRSKFWIVHGKVFDSSYDAAKFFGYSVSHVQFLCDGRPNGNKRSFYYEPFCYSVRKYDRKKTVATR